MGGEGARMKGKIKVFSIQFLVFSVQSEVSTKLQHPTSIRLRQKHYGETGRNSKLQDPKLSKSSIQYSVGGTSLQEGDSILED